MRPPIRGQAPPPLPTVVLLTDDVDNRSKAEKDGIPCSSGERVFRLQTRATNSPVRLLIVRRYVEGMPKSTQLVDLLSAGSNSIEPTAAAGRPPLYSEVSSCQSSKPAFLTGYGRGLVFIYRCTHGRSQSRPIVPRPFQCKPIQLFGG